VRAGSFVRLRTVVILGEARMFREPASSMVIAPLHQKNSANNGDIDSLGSSADRPAGAFVAAPHNPIASSETLRGSGQAALAVVDERSAMQQGIDLRMLVACTSTS